MVMIWLDTRWATRTLAEGDQVDHAQGPRRIRSSPVRRRGRKWLQNIFFKSVMHASLECRTKICFVLIDILSVQCRGWRYREQHIPRALLRLPKRRAREHRGSSVIRCTRTGLQNGHRSDIPPSTNHSLSECIAEHRCRTTPPTLVGWTTNKTHTKSLIFCLPVSAAVA